MEDEVDVLLTNPDKIPCDLIQVRHNTTRKCPLCARRNNFDATGVYGSQMFYYNDGLKVFYWNDCGHHFYDHQLRNERRKRVMAVRKEISIKNRKPHFPKHGYVGFELKFNPPNWRPHNESNWYHTWGVGR